MPVHPSYPSALVRRDVGAAGRSGEVAPGAFPTRPVELAEPDPAWPARFEAEATRVRDALGAVAVRIEHVGSTAVPGLPAKPIIDIDLQVVDTAAEDAYVPPLVAAGFALVLREPWWDGHRMFLGEGGGSHLHVFPVGAPELLRHLLFRDWLRSHPDDRQLYAATKHALAASTAAQPERYSLAKNDVIDEIYGRIFSVSPREHPAWPPGGWDATAWSAHVRASGA